jgi:flagellar motor switch protein FliM
MAQVLSQEEIDALLTNAESAEAIPAQEESSSTADRYDGKSKAVLYDFKHPNRVSKDQLRSLESIHDNFANQFGSQLSGFTRSVVDVDLISVDQITYSEFIMSLASPSCTYVFALDPIDGAGIVDFNPAIAFSFVDRMFGGKGKALNSERELTGIEKSIMSKIIARAFQALGKSWEHVEKLEFRQSGFESNPQFVQIVPPGETVVVVSLQIKMLSSSGLVTLCYPYLTLEPIMDRLSTQHWIEARKKGDDSSRYETNVKSLMNVIASLKVYLGGTQVTVSELMNLKSGDVVRLDQTENDPAVVYVGNRKKFLARPGRTGKMKAIKVTNII